MAWWWAAEAAVQIRHLARHRNAELFSKVSRSFAQLKTSVFTFHFALGQIWWQHWDVQNLSEKFNRASQNSFGFLWNVGMFLPMKEPPICVAWCFRGDDSSKWRLSSGSLLSFRGGGGEGVGSNNESEKIPGGIVGGKAAGHFCGSSWGLTLSFITFLTTCF